MNYTYILMLRNDSYYIGSTTDLAVRFNNHQKGRVRSTKNKLPAKIIYVEEFFTYAEARKREYQLKGWKSRKAIERLISDNIYSGPIV